LYFGVWVRGCIVKKLVDSEFEICLGAGGDCGGNGADRLLHCVVDGFCIVIEEATKDLAEM